MNTTEYKTQRTSLTLQPSVYKAAKAIAKSRRQSFNDLVHMLLEEYIEEYNTKQEDTNGKIQH